MDYNFVFMLTAWRKTYSGIHSLVWSSRSVLWRLNDSTSGIRFGGFRQLNASHGGSSCS